MQAKSASNVKIIDVSHHQGSIDWSSVKSDGVRGAFIKATEGRTGIDLKFAANASGAAAVGLPVGFYHYAHPETNTPEDEAANFYRTVKGFKAAFPHVLDVEGDDAAELGRDKLTEWCQLWLQEVERLTGHPAMIYTGASFSRSYLGKELGIWPLWIAHYGADKPMDNDTWDSWAVFQYTSGGSVAGITGNVDVNAMEKAFFDKCTGAAPLIEPASPEDTVKIVVNDKLAAYGRLIGGHAYLPLRQLGEALGVQVDWVAKEATPYVGGKRVTAFQLINGKTYIGVRAAAELLGGIVSWDNGTKKVYLYK